MTSHWGQTGKVKLHMHHHSLMLHTNSWQHFSWDYYVPSWCQFSRGKRGEDDQWKLDIKFCWLKKRVHCDVCLLVIRSTSTRWWTWFASTLPWLRRGRRLPDKSLIKLSLTLMTWTFLIPQKGWVLLQFANILLHHKNYFVQATSMEMLRKISLFLKILMKL